MLHLMLARTDVHPTGPQEFSPSPAPLDSGWGIPLPSRFFCACYVASLPARSSAAASASSTVFRAAGCGMEMMLYPEST